MNTDSAHTNRMRRIFLDGFTAADLAEGLVSFDDTAEAAEVASVAQQRKLRILGVRRAGVVVGYALTEELAPGTLAEFAHPLAEHDVISSSASIPEVIAALEDRSWVFVEVFDRIGGIVTRTDIQKPVMRMWLFGMITILEMNLTWAIEQLYPDDSWTDRISAGRVEKARELMAERERRKQDCRLVDCLQFSDRGDILLKDEESRQILGYASRREAERAIKMTESLRNNLAHSQDIVAYDWDAISRLVGSIDGLLTRKGVNRLVAVRNQSPDKGD